MGKAVDRGRMCIGPYTLMIANIQCTCLAELLPLSAFLISATLLQVEEVEAAGSDAKYQGWPPKRPEVIALRQRRGERRNGDAGFFRNLFFWI